MKRFKFMILSGVSIYKNKFFIKKFTYCNSYAQFLKKRKNIASDNKAVEFTVIS